MTPESKKKFNITVGSIFIFLGLVSFGVAAYVASVPATPKPAPTSGMPIVSAQSCRDTLMQMGYRASLESGGAINATDGSMDDPQAALTKATAAIGLCKMTMTEFCFGNSCAIPGLTFSLAPIAKPVIPPAKLPAAEADKNKPSASSTGTPAKPVNQKTN